VGAFRIIVGADLTPALYHVSAGKSGLGLTNKVPTMPSLEATQDESAHLIVRGGHARGLDFRIIPDGLVAPLLALSLALGCGGALPSRLESPNAGHCALVDSATVRARLSDGQPVVLERRAFVEQGAGYLLLGDRAFIDTGTRFRQARVNDADAIGVLLDQSGLATLVPPPPGARHFVSPKVLRADASGADVLWLDPDSVVGDTPRPARIMTARYERGAWSTATAVANVSRLLISRNEPAQPTSIAGGVALAVSQLSPDSGTLSELLVEQNGIWSGHAIASGYRPLYPSLATLGNSWILTFTGIDPTHSIGLFVVRSNDAGVTWSSPYLVAAGRAYEERLLALGQGLALVWVGEHENYRPRGVHVAFSRDGTHWTSSAAFDAANDSTTAAMAMAFDDSRIALVRLIGVSAERIESLEIVSSTARDVLWTKPLTALSPPLLLKHGTDTITLLTNGAHGTGSSVAPYMTLSWGRVRCD
jgi:hypothetical protein